MNGRGNNRAFTLIELMIVVVMISAIALVAVPMLLRFQQRGKGLAPVEETAPPPVARPGAEETVPTVRPLVDEADVKVALEVRHRLYGMDVYTIYEAALEGTFLFRNVSSSKKLVKIAFPFPAHANEARDVSLLFAKGDGVSWLEPEGVSYRQDGITWIGPMERGSSIRAKVTYTAQGQKKFVFQLPGDGLARKVDFKLTSPYVTADFVPRESLQPTKSEAGVLSWNYLNVVADRPIVVDLPGGTSPIGRVMLLCKLVSLAVLLFGAGFWYLSEEFKPGQLDDFEWGHFLLLATTYSLFFVIFAVLSYNDASRPAIHMAISALLSLPLLMLHVTRFVSRKFALTRVLPLAIFTLGLVINGVYGGLYRDYIFIGAAVLTMAYVTVTFQKWLTGLEEYEKVLQKKRSFKERLKKAKLAFNGFEGVIKTTTAALADAREALEPPSDDDKEEWRIAIEAEIEKIDELKKEKDSFANEFSELQKSDSDVHAQKTEDFIFIVHRQTDKLSAAITALSGATSSLLQGRDLAIRKREAGKELLQKSLDKLRRACTAASSFIDEAKETKSALGKEKELTVLLDERIESLQSLTAQLPELEKLPTEVKPQKVRMKIDRVILKINEKIELLKKTINESVIVEEVKASSSLVHCLACGHTAPPSDHCPACGTKHPITVVCSQCNTRWRHPIHLIDKVHLDDEIHCLGCGTSLGKVAKS